MLTEQQIRHFHDEGYLFLPETFTGEECAFLREEAIDIYRHDRPEVWRERSGAPRTAFAAHLYNEAFGLLARHPRMIEPIEQVFGEQVYMHQFKINAKASFNRRRLAMASGLRHLGSRRRDAGAAGNEHRGVPG